MDDDLGSEVTSVFPEGGWGGGADISFLFYAGKSLSPSATRRLFFARARGFYCLRRISQLFLLPRIFSLRLPTRSIDVSCEGALNMIFQALKKIATSEKSRTKKVSQALLSLSNKAEQSFARRTTLNFAKLKSF